MVAMNKIIAKADRVTVWIYEAIENGFAQRLRDEIHTAQARVIELRINSPGGVVSEAAAAFALLKGHAARVEVIIDGVAASAASFLAMAGNKISMAENALLMIHNPWTTATGDAAELRRTADVLDKHAEILLQAYGRSKLSRAELERLLDAEAWMTAREALAAGFIDEIHTGEAFAACAHKNCFLNLPERFKPMTTAAQTADNETRAAILAAEAKRREDIEAKFAKFEQVGGMAELKVACLKDTGCTAALAGERILAEMGRDAFSVMGAVSIADNHDRASDFVGAVTDAVLAKHGVRVPNPHPAARDVMGMGMLDVARNLLSQRGVNASLMTPSKLIKAAMTSSDLPLLLESIAHKSLMTGFESVEAASHRVWTRAGTLTDFRAASRVALSEAPGLDSVPEMAEYTHGSLTDAREQIQLQTFGKIITLSRQMLINDELGSLARLPVALGQAAARKESDIVYGLLTGNPAMRDGKTLFHADHGNIGTPGALSVAALGDARKLMRLQRGLAGEAALNIVPAFLIVPAALETTAEQLLAEIQPNATADVVPGWVRSLQIVVDPRLDAVSETAWYLAAHPDQADTIEVALLDGNGVTIETEEGFLQDATSFKVRLDVGAAALDWRGLVRNAGA